MRLVMRERSLHGSPPLLGYLAASSSIVGITTIPQGPRSPRNQPRNTRINIAASRRSVFARLAFARHRNACRMDDMRLDPAEQSASAPARSRRGQPS